MGLDIGLGILIFVSAVRGWLRGFVIQSIRLAGLVGSVYAAGPVRDYARPYIQSYLTTIRPALLDRLLWWAAAVLVYVVSVGLASLALKMYRRRPFGEAEPNRTDQFAGFLLGAVRGAVIAAFLVSGLQKYAVDRLKSIDWADEQAKGSFALMWDAQYRPAEKVWNSVPVQHFVGEVKRMGLRPPADASSSPEPKPAEAREPIQAATNSGPPRLGLPLPGLDPTSPGFAEDFDRMYDLVVPREVKRN